MEEISPGQNRDRSSGRADEKALPAAADALLLSTSRDAIHCGYRQSWWRKKVPQTGGCQPNRGPIESVCPSPPTTRRPDAVEYNDRRTAIQQRFLDTLQGICKVQIQEANHDDTTSTTPYFRGVRRVVVDNFVRLMV